MKDEMKHGSHTHAKGEALHKEMISHVGKGHNHGFFGGGKHEGERPAQKGSKGSANGGGEGMSENENC
jgi:hypothetical protein